MAGQGRWSVDRREQLLLGDLMNRVEYDKQMCGHSNGEGNGRVVASMIVQRVFDKQCLATGRFTAVSSPAEGT